MKWQAIYFNNTYELVYKFWTVKTMRFNGKFWDPGKKKKGVLVKMKCWHGEIWYLEPESVLRPIDIKGDK